MWVLAFVMPTVAIGQQMYVFTAAALPVWAGVFVLTSVTVALHRSAFTRLGTHR